MPGTTDLNESGGKEKIIITTPPQRKKKEKKSRQENICDVLQLLNVIVAQVETENTNKCGTLYCKTPQRLRAAA